MQELQYVHVDLEIYHAVYSVNVKIAVTNQTKLHKGMADCIHDLFIVFSDFVSYFILRFITVPIEN